MGDQRIQVAVRVRPMNPKEIELGNIMVWRVMPPNLIELEDDGRTPTGKSWPFDCVFESRLSTRHVFEKASMNIVEGALNGFNGTFFAYGQTSSGKTFTLMGDIEKNPGVTPLSIQTVFKWIDDHPETEWDVNIGYIEIYNETVVDLLDPDEKTCRNKKVVEDKQFGPNVRDLVEVRALTPQHCLQTLARGETRRSFAMTEMNANSSRSHTLFRMRIESRVVDEDKQAETKATIQDLANSLVSSQQLVNADRASLYLVDRDNGELYIQAGDVTYRSPLTQGIAGACATKAETIFIADAYKDKRFNPNVDKSTGYRTRSILCLPVKNHDGMVSGVVQLINKMPDLEFSQDDVELVTDKINKIGELITAAQSNVRTTTMSRLNLVDLAGSERQDKTGATGNTLTEANNINRSLMALGKCINLLSESKSPAHVPFRESVLTRLLSTSLGGNTRTCIFCAISPAMRNRAETISTLQFGSRAKKIQTSASKNTKKDEGQLLSAMENEIAKLKAELTKAKESATQMAQIDDYSDEEDDLFDGNVDAGEGVFGEDNNNNAGNKRRKKKVKIRGPVMLVISDEAAFADGQGKRNRAISLIDAGVGEPAFMQDPDSAKEQAREFSNRFAALRDECAEVQETANKLQPEGAPEVALTALVGLTTHNLLTQDLLVKVSRVGNYPVQFLSQAQFSEILIATRNRDESVRLGGAMDDWYFPQLVYSSGPPAPALADSRDDDSDIFDGFGGGGGGGTGDVFQNVSREEDLIKIQKLEESLEQKERQFKARLQQQQQMYKQQLRDKQTTIDELEALPRDAWVWTEEPDIRELKEMLEEKSKRIEELEKRGGGARFNISDEQLAKLQEQLQADPTQLKGLLEWRPKLEQDFIEPSFEDLEVRGPSRQESVDHMLQVVMQKFMEGSRERVRHAQGETSTFQSYLQRLEEVDKDHLLKCGQLLKQARGELQQMDQDSVKRRIEECRLDG